MNLRKLQLSRFRNFSAMVMQPQQHLNLVYGENGSGKSSLFEAIFLLGRGKSFRVSRNSLLIQQGSTEATVFGEVESPGTEPESGATVPIGIAITTGRTIFRARGEKLKKSSELARFLPLAYLGADCARQLSDGPQYRRRLLDWGVFHVEHHYPSIWMKFSRILKQRNCMLRLRSRPSDLAFWDEQFIAESVRLHEFRKTYVEALVPIFNQFIEQMLRVTTLNPASLKLVYRPGWDEHFSLEAILARQYSRDLELGHTQSGAHRADLNIFLGDSPADVTASSGQMKLLASALFLAQLALLRERSHLQPVALVDDLPSELDDDHRYRFLELLQGLKIQAFVSATEKQLLDYDPISWSGMFHVKQGNIVEAS